MKRPKAIYPLPWSVADIENDYDIIDADGKVAARAAHGDRELAEFIVQRVNAHDGLLKDLDKLGEIATRVARSRALAYGECEKLRNLVRRLRDEYEQMEECDTVCNTDRCRRIEVLFREALGEEVEE